MCLKTSQINVISKLDFSLKTDLLVLYIVQMNSGLHHFNKFRRLIDD